ncbi:MAG TPA: DNA polymerase III subunit [Polyangiaceae bacterium]|jgi:DNA polymerase-3 subunit delta'|nr:DNA polymerase III subunit [Polyangiaceae bacterium]
MAPFSEILGQEPALETLERALAGGHVHHAYRFEGPEGVGKERAAFALAQALVCERGGARACTECSACQRALRISEEEPRVPAHPDVVLLERGLYRGRISANEATGISIEQVRRIVLERVGFRPHEGRALVFIVRAAEELTVSAANALLKTLEEPGPSTYFILLTSRPNRLLDTIRSRTLPVRFSPLSDALVAQILQSKGLDPKVAPLAQGSVALALELASEDAIQERDEFVSAAEAAIDARDLAPALKFAEVRRERDRLRGLLAYFAQTLALAGREAVSSDLLRAERCASRHGVVLAALRDVERNVSPALALEAMIYRMRGT